MITGIVLALAVVMTGVWFFFLRASPDEKVAQIYINAILSDDVETMIENTFGGESLLDFAVTNGRAPSRRDAIRQIRNEMSDTLVSIRTLEIIGKKEVSGRERNIVYDEMNSFEYFGYNTPRSSGDPEDDFGSGYPDIRTIYRFDVRAEIYRNGNRRTVNTELYVGLVGVGGMGWVVLYYGDLKF